MATAKEREAAAAGGGLVARRPLLFRLLHRPRHAGNHPRRGRHDDRLPPAAPFDGRERPEALDLGAPARPRPAPRRRRRRPCRRRRSEGPAAQGGPLHQYGHV